MPNRSFLFAWVMVFASACGPDSSVCSAEIHCELVDGAASCTEGYQWTNESDPNDFRCEKIPVIVSPVSQFGSNVSLRFSVFATTTHGLNVPRDLEFHPDRPNELWTINRATDSVLIIFDPDTAEQREDARLDAFRDHFMEEVSALAFGSNNTFGTCHETRNTFNGQAPPNDFMGPALWPADLGVFAQVNQNVFGELQGSHLDMLHQSPLCMGIAHDVGNAYWVFDGLNEHVVYYDFRLDHGPGGEDHSDGIVRRYPEANVTRVADVPSHMVLDSTTGLLYVADTGTSRVFRLQTKSGSNTRDLRTWSMNEPLAEFSEFTGATVEDVVTTDLTQPSGIAIAGSTLFVSDHKTNEVVAYTLDGQELDRIQTPAQGIAGITIGPGGHLWYVDLETNQAVHVIP